MKGPEYVSLTTRVYRQAVDAAWAALHGGAGGSDADALAAAKQAVQLPDRTRWDLEQASYCPAIPGSRT